jgi:uncharacterized DUF497 family protein
VRIDSLEWDENNTGHIARHGIAPGEVEEICYGFHISKKESGLRYILAGKTGSGRYLDIVIERLAGNAYRPVTAFEMSQNYKASFRRQTGK